jgi:hypothetical protein
MRCQLALLHIRSHPRNVYLAYQHEGGTAYASFGIQMACKQTKPLGRSSTTSPGTVRRLSSFRLQGEVALHHRNKKWTSIKTPELSEMLQIFKHNKGALLSPTIPCTTDHGLRQGANVFQV